MRRCRATSMRKPRRTSDERHRDDDRGEDDVRDEDGEVERADWPVAWERLRADMRVIDDVGDQEQRRHHERRDHARAVRLMRFPLDESAPGGEQAAGGGVQRRVERRQVLDRHARWMEQTARGGRRASAAAALAGRPARRRTGCRALSGVRLRAKRTVSASRPDAEHEGAGQIHAAGDPPRWASG